MKKILTLLGISLFLIVSFTNCSKDEEAGSPTMTFKNETGYITQNTTASYGDTLLFGINANSNGEDNLVKFTVSVNNQLLLDSTINSQTFAFDFYTIKSAADVEAWTMTITDVAGHTASLSATITGEFGEIDSYTTILMGAQDNVDVESFLSLADNHATTYMQAAAFEYQDKIDMFCYYENTPEHQNMMTLGSPGSNITGIFSGATSPENYTTKNLTYFVKTTLSASNFDAVQNDAWVLASFDPENQFKKAKVLTAGDVYAFKLQSGKYGLLKVIEVTGTETGTLEIGIKVQK
ncbi:MAG TPA: hypothetical protein VK212_10645 [Lentimicrobium sp.]|nr:hypothetical protein [Lentimicrobium sp.]